jgi:hypothetical protein
MFGGISSNRGIAIGNILKLCHEIKFNLINPLPTYHYEKENKANSLSRNPSPVLFPRHRHSFPLPFVPVPYVEKNEVFPDEDEVLVTRKRNISTSPDPLPNCMRFKNDKKRFCPYNLEILQSTIY